MCNFLETEGVGARVGEGVEGETSNHNTIKYFTFA